MAVEEVNHEDEINLLLRQMGRDFGSLSSYERKEVVQIYDEVQKMKREQEDAKTAMKAAKINITNVSKRTGLSNKTFYNNNHFLKDFLSLMSNDSESDSSSEKIRSLKNKNKELQNQLNLYIKENIISTELVACENDALTERLVELEKSFQRLNELYNAAQAEIAKLKGNPFSGFVFNK